MDPLLETDNANDSDFQSKIAQQTTDIVLDRKSLFLEYLSSGEERPSFLACKRLDCASGRVADPAGSGSCAEFQSVSLNLLRLRTLTRLDFGRSVTS